MANLESEENPFLQGNFAPVKRELDETALEVIGEIPRDLRGTYYRNGPNQAFEPIGRYHWFDGDGMIHAIRLEDGRASYRNRWVESDGLKEEREAGQALYPGLLEIKPTEAPRFKSHREHEHRRARGQAPRAGRELAADGAPPAHARDDRSLRLRRQARRRDDRASEDGSRDRRDAFLRLLAVPAVPAVPRRRSLGRARPLGADRRRLAVDDPRLRGDRIHAIFLLCPIVFDFENAAKGGSIFRWDPDRGTRIGVMPRRGTSADVRWFDTDPCYVFHPMNAYEENGTVTLDVHRYEQLLFMDPSSARNPDWRGKQVARLHRWQLDLAAGTIRSQALDDHEGEFPRVDERLVGRKHRFGYFAAVGPEGNPTLHPEFTSVAKIDLERGGKVEVRAHGEGNGCGEPVFVPRSEGAAEDDGWVVYLSYDRARNASDFTILDARDIAGEPVAKIRIPQRVPYGFHGNFVAD